MSNVALFIATVIVALLAFESGLRFGRWRSQRPNPEPLLPARTLVASTLHLLAFILGFVFGQSSSHFDARNRAIFDESNAIGAAYHRADFLPDPERTNVQHLLLEYVDRRLDVARSGRVDAEAKGELRWLQNEIWAQTVAAAKRAPTPSSTPLVQSLTDVIDVDAERVLAGLQSRIPFRVWVSLYLIMVLSVAAAGYHAGLAGAHTSFAAVSYAVVFAAVIVMIAAGDVPQSDQFRASGQALTDLRSRLTNREMPAGWQMPAR